MGKTMNKEAAIARLGDLGFRYIGASEARQLLDAADAPGSGPGPQPEPEPMPTHLVGLNHSSILVDKYSLTPGPDFIKQMLPGAKFVGEMPRMFSSGDLPVLTGSGESPQTLRYLPWQLRHAGALTQSRSHLLALIEESAAGGDVERLQTSQGRQLLGEYMIRCRAWAIRPPEVELTDEEVDSLFPSWSSVVND